MKYLTVAAIALACVAGTASASPELAKSSGCMGCHNVDKKIVGPAFSDVAKKYKGDAKAEAHIVHVIHEGSKGVWGQIAMPKQAQVKDDTAAALAKWILSL